jgi:hypothetical protein
MAPRNLAVLATYAQHHALQIKRHGEAIANARAAAPLYSVMKPGAARACWLALAAGHRRAIGNLAAQIKREAA